MEETQREQRRRTAARTAHETAAQREEERRIAEIARLTLMQTALYCSEKQAVDGAAATGEKAKAATRQSATHLVEHFDRDKAARRRRAASARQERLRERELLAAVALRRASSRSAPSASDRAARLRAVQATVARLEAKVARQSVARRMSAEERADAIAAKASAAAVRPVAAAPRRRRQPVQVVRDEPTPPRPWLAAARARSRPARLRARSPLAYLGRPRSSSLSPSVGRWRPEQPSEHSRLREADCAAQPASAAGGASRPLRPRWMARRARQPPAHDFYRVEAELLEAALGADGALELLEQRDAHDTSWDAQQQQQQQQQQQHGRRLRTSFVRVGGREEALASGRGVTTLARSLHRRQQQGRGGAAPEHIHDRQSTAQ